MAFDAHKIREDFPILSYRAEGGPLVYFDNAASAQKPAAVIDCEADFYRSKYSNIHRSAHELSRKATVAFEAARKTVGEFFGAPEGYSTVFTRGSTESLNIVAFCYGGKFLKAGDEIILSQMEHHANIVPWQEVARRTGAAIRVADILPDGSLDMDSLRSLVSARTKIISICHASNVLGTVNDIAEISKIARSAGALFNVDCAQSAPHCLDDLRAADCDFISVSAHKCFGPGGVGALIGRTGILNSMDIWMGGGDMIESVSWGGTTYRTAPEKFEAGTPNIAGAAAFARALEYLKSLDLEGAKLHEAALLKRLSEGIGQIRGLRILGVAERKTPIVSFVCEGVHPNDISTMLDASGIAVRSGHHCAEPLMDRLGVKGSCRASLAFYNTVEEVDFFIEKLKKAIHFLRF